MSLGIELGILGFLVGLRVWTVAQVDAGARDAIVRRRQREDV